jgi:hypothetical protein
MPEDSIALLRQENRDLWDKLSTLQALVNQLMTVVTRIEARLDERCGERGVQIADLRRRQDDVESVQSHRPCDRHDERIKNIERVMWCLGGAVVTIMARLVYLWLSTPHVPGVTQ